MRGLVARPISTSCAWLARSKKKKSSALAGAWDLEVLRGAEREVSWLRASAKKGDRHYAFEN
ncbi:hypothetical protein CFELI_02655 [Corynebacterium felinum]|uniref:Uncharacterized protein n=1 Tax=Corynebacterium felinum TaxID=131318 RepID=A0ABU2B872_9CORY|nr:hypothetical protein [Corynebacterium felinum]WJY94173.1 hypothetical protein CFELI_02655 [Corynebacterium felinum]